MTTKDAITGAQQVRPPTLPHGRPPGDPLDLLLERLKRHPRVDAAALLLVDTDRMAIEPAAAWFASPALHDAIEPAMRRPYDRGLPVLVEAALERSRSLFLPRVEDWEAAPQLRHEIEQGVGEDASAAWESFAVASLIACPVRTGLGRTLGVLIAGSVDPGRPLRRSDLETLEALADVAALARERAELVEGETARSRDELLLKRASEDTAASLESPEVQQHIVDHALRLVNADRAILSRVQPSGGLVTAAAAGGGGPQPPAGALAKVARSRTARTFGGPSPSLHVPIVLGPRLFGILTAVRTAGPAFKDRDAEVLQRLARSSAAAIANAIDFERERRIARALTRGFVPDSLPEVAGYDVGLLYEPAANQPAGGDLYGAWALPGGDVAVLVGDVAGKGVETAALSAMARFFIEARSWDCDSPAEALTQANTMLSSRLPSDTFVTAFLGRLTDTGVRYANAGHLAPVLLRADGELGELPGRGLPLGIDELPALEERELRLDAGDLLLGFTDGLVEARRGGELFGLERLHATVAAAAAGAANAQYVVRHVHERVREWAGGLSDDAALLALRRH